jgi:D-amino acid aminotransferase
VKEPIVYQNGRFLRASRAVVGVADRGFLYGDALFETVRVYRGRPFAVAEHFARLRRGAKTIRLRVPWTRSEWETTIVELVRRNRLANADVAVRLTLTRGVGGDGLILPRRQQPTVVMTVRTLPRGLVRLQRRGVRVVLLPFHPGSGGLLAGIKSVDYLTAALGKTIARERGAFEGVYRTAGGELLEGTTSNLFLVAGSHLLTPPLGRGVLAGVTRGIVIDLAAEAGLRVRERRLRESDLRHADEAFLTASTIEVLPIRAVEGRRFGPPGPRTRTLQDLYRQVVAAGRTSQKIS